MPQMTAEELAEEKQAISLLSPEERAAMGEGDEDNDIIKDIAKDADDDGKKATPAADKNGAEDDDSDEDDDEDDDPADDNDDADGAKAKAEAAAQESAAAVKTEAAAKAADAGAQAEPIAFDFAPIEKSYQNALDELDAGKAVKFKEFCGGTLSEEDYSKFESKYLRDRDAAAAQRNDAIAWFREVNAFQNDVLKADGINYSTDQKMNSAFDRWVKQLANEPENAQKDGGWFLKEAHEMVKLQYRIGQGKPAAAATTEKPAKPDEKPAKPPGRAPNTSTLPPTLGKLPAAAENEASDGGEFAHLDNLKGIDLERALARMTEDQADRYLRG